MTDLLLLGGGGHCRSVIDVIENCSGFSVRGIVQPRVDGITPVLGYPVLGEDGDLEELLAGGKAALVTVGQIHSSALRRRLYTLLLEYGASLPTVASRNATVSKHAVLGAGTVVLHGAVVNAAAKVGVNCIINSLALLEHDVVVGNHVHVATGARINGGAKLGNGCFVGSGATVYQGVCVGDDCVIAAGAVVTSDLPAGTVFRRCLCSQK
jgi:sugar O-acyltransferase (sialic acid O-acetyltransferase NeuD family)